MSIPKIIICLYPTRQKNIKTCSIYQSFYEILLIHTHRDIIATLYLDKQQAILIKVYLNFQICQTLCHGLILYAMNKFMKIA